MTDTSIQCYHEHLVLAVPEGFDVNQAHQQKRLPPSMLKTGIFDVPVDMCVSLNDFAGVPFLMLRNGNYLRQCVDSLFQECHMASEIAMEPEQSAVSYNFASMGIGAAILSNMLVEDSFKNSRLCFYKINSRLALRDTWLAYRNHCYISYAMKTFIEMLTEKGLPFRLAAPSSFL